MQNSRLVVVAACCVDTIISRGKSIQLKVLDKVFEININKVLT